MKYRINNTMATIVATVALMTSGVSHASPYTFQTYDNPAGPTFNQLLGINNAGTIAGYYGSGVAGQPNQGYTLVTPSTYTNENFPGSVQTQVTGINNIGTTVGFWSNTNNGTDANFGFVDQQGVFTNVNNPNAGSSPVVNQLLGVNDQNVAVGFYNDGAGNSHGYTYTVGSGVFTPVNYGGAVSLTATSINNLGEIGGFYVNAGGTTSGFLDVNGNFTTLNAPNAIETMIFGLNNNGIAVGQATTNGDATVGVIYDPAKNSWQELSKGSGLSTTFNGINDQGAIVGFYVDNAGNTNGLLVTAVPEPGTVFLFGAGGLLMLVVSRRWRSKSIAYA